MIRAGPVTLRPVRRRDARALSPVLGDPTVMAFSARGALSPRALRRWVGEAAQRGAPTSRWVILAPATGVVGYVALTRQARGRAVFGIRLARRAWGRGWALAAGAAALARLGAKPGVAEVVAEVDPGNRASLRLLGRLGFKPMGQVLRPGYTHPDWVLRWQAPRREAALREAPNSRA